MILYSTRLNGKVKVKQVHHNGKTFFLTYTSDDWMEKNDFHWIDLKHGSPELQREMLSNVFHVTQKPKHSDQCGLTSPSKSRVDKRKKECPLATRWGRTLAPNMNSPAKKLRRCRDSDLDCLVYNFLREDAKLWKERDRDYIAFEMNCLKVDVAYLKKKRAVKFCVLSMTLANSRHCLGVMKQRAMPSVSVGSSSGSLVLFIMLYLFCRFCCVMLPVLSFHSMVFLYTRIKLWLKKQTGGDPTNVPQLCSLPKWYWVNKKSK